MAEPLPEKSRKRKADSLGRIGAASSNQTTTSSTTKTTGRGAATGWTQCPLCCGEGASASKQQQSKLYALGRGIAAHLHAVHAPWNPPGKAECRRRKRLAERRKAEAARRRETHKQKKEDPPEQAEARKQEPIVEESRETTTWEPTPKEIEEWDSTVLQIVAQLEEKAKSTSSNNNEPQPLFVRPGHDRSGK